MFDGQDPAKPRNLYETLWTMAQIYDLLPINWLGGFRPQ